MRDIAGLFLRSVACALKYAEMLAPQADCFVILVGHDSGYLMEVGTLASARADTELLVQLTRVFEPCLLRRRVAFGVAKGVSGPRACASESFAYVAVAFAEGASGASRRSGESASGVVSSNHERRVGASIAECERV